MLSHFFDYLRYELNRSPLTVKAYRQDILQFARWISNTDTDEDLGKIDFASVSQADIRAWMGSLAREGDTARTIRRKSQSLRALFRWLQKSGVIASSPLRDIPLPKLPKPLPDIVRSDEIEEAISMVKDNGDNLIKGLRNALIIELLYSLGIRRAELIALNDSDISFPKGEIKVTGKRSKQRVVPAPQALLAKILEWQKIRDDDFPWDHNDSPLFRIKGKRISEKTVYNIVREALAASTAKKRSPHALRHSFASGMLNGGANLDAVKEFLGHASLATTQIYTHISLNDIKKAYKNAHPRSFDDKK